MLKKTELIFFLTVTMSLFFFPFHSFAKGKIYGQSKTLSKEYTKYEKCRLKETLLNIKDETNILTLLDISDLNISNIKLNNNINCVLNNS